MLQDEVKVIYSVGYPHQPDSQVSFIEQVQTTAGEALSNATSWFKEVLGKQTGSQVFDADSGNAWGLDAFGLRIATIQNVSKLPEEPCS